MSSVTIGVDLAKNVFEIAVSVNSGAIRERRRLSRPQFEQFWAKHAPCRVVMEACSTAHFWARHLRARGFDVLLLPPHYVAPYRRRRDRKSTRLNSSHSQISYAVFCLKKKKNQ